jgi:hypothetical protein
MYVTPELYALLVEGPWLTTDQEMRWNRIRADIDRYIEGDVMAVRRPESYAKRAQFARLLPVHGEVWAFRSWVPRPSMRVFGSFAWKDCFIALQWRERSLLGAWRSRAWRNVRVQCGTDWRNLFNAYPPHSGGYPDEYISNVVLV